MLCVFRRHQYDATEWRAPLEMWDPHAVLLLLATMSVSVGFLVGMLWFIERAERMAVREFALDSL
jgi:cell shape-determining protein MreD